MWSYDDTLGDYVQQFEAQVTEWGWDGKGWDRMMTAYGLPSSRGNRADMVCGRSGGFSVPRST